MSAVELLSTLISAAIVCIIGVILLFIGHKTSRPRIYWGGIGFVLAAGVAVFVEFKEIRDVLTAFAAIFAAFIAAYSIDETRRLRQDNIDREGRDRTELLLSEIIRWLKELENRTFFSGERYSVDELSKDSTLKRKLGLDNKEFWRIKDVTASLDQLKALRNAIKEGEYINKLASKLDASLSSLTKAILDHLEIRRQLVFDSAQLEHPIDIETIRKSVKGLKLSLELIKDKTKPLDGLTLSEEELASVKLGRNAGDIKESILKALDKAIEIKIDLLKS